MKISDETIDWLRQQLLILKEQNASLKRRLEQKRYVHIYQGGCYGTYAGNPANSRNEAMLQLSRLDLNNSEIYARFDDEGVDKYLITLEIGDEITYHDFREDWVKWRDDTLTEWVHDELHIKSERTY